MKLTGHPSHHGHHQNPYTCLAGQHRSCDGFSGGHDTYRCGCCCHDHVRELTVDDQAIVRRLLGTGAEQ